MNSQFATAMSRALEQTRAGNPAGATRIIQDALAGTGRPPSGAAAPAQSPTVFRGRPLAGIEDADVVEDRPSWPPVPPFAAPSRKGIHAWQTDQGDLRRMLDNLGCMVP